MKISETFCNCSVFVNEPRADVILLSYVEVGRALICFCMPLD